MRRRRLYYALCAVALAGAVLAVSRVRAGAPPGRYEDNGDGTVTDTKTKLIWQKGVPDEMYTWQAAKEHCANIDLPGAGWRLPSVKALQTILDRTGPSPAIDSAAFPGLPGELFWTSTCFAPDSCPDPGSRAWLVNFGAGIVNWEDTSLLRRARCVR